MNELKAVLTAQKLLKSGHRRKVIKYKLLNEYGIGPDRFQRIIATAARFGVQQ